MAKTVNNFDRYGNCSAASNPMLLDECVRSGRLDEGQLVCMAGFPINPLPGRGPFQNGISSVDGDTRPFIVEVSSAVINWVQRGGNTGFMITDNDERAFPEATARCLSTYGTFKLLVGYYRCMRPAPPGWRPAGIPCAGGRLWSGLLCGGVRWYV